MICVEQQAVRFPFACADGNLKTVSIQRYFFSCFVLLLSLCLIVGSDCFFYCSTACVSATPFFLYEYNSAYSDTVISFFQLFINVFVVTFVDNGTMLIFFFLLFLPCVKRIHFHQHCCMYVCVAQ